MEITMNNLLAAGALDAQDFLSRVDLLADIGFTVLISNYSEYYRLTSYFRRYTKEMIGVAMGINNLLEIFNEKYYENLEGGILESFGRLFRNSVKLYIYPMTQGGLRDVHRPGRRRATARRCNAFSSSVLINAKNVRVVDHLSNLYAHLLENHYIDCIVGFDTDILNIFSRDVLRRIKEKDPAWEKMVPKPVAEAIKRRGLFGYSEHPDPRRRASSMRFHKYHALGNDYIVLDPADYPRRGRGRARPRSASSATGTSAWDRTGSFGAPSPPSGPTSACASSTPTAPRRRSRATG